MCTVWSKAKFLVLFVSCGSPQHLLSSCRGLLDLGLEVFPTCSMDLVERICSGPFYRLRQPVFSLFTSKDPLNHPGLCFTLKLKSNRQFEIFSYPSVTSVYEVKAIWYESKNKYFKPSWQKNDIKGAFIPVFLYFPLVYFKKPCGSVLCRCVYPLAGLLSIFLVGFSVKLLCTIIDSAIWGSAQWMLL